MKKIIPFLITSLIFQIAVAQTVQLEIKVFIEGPYYNGQMTPFLNVLGYLPTSQPYNTTPWNYPGTELVTEFPSSNIVDWVLVDVLKPHTDGDQIKFELIGRKAGFLFKTGLIKDIDGISNLIIQSDISSGFYVRIHHRNHLSVISAVPLVESGGVFTYDFTFPADQAMGGSLSQKQLSSVIWGMIAADANASGQIDNRDKNDVWLPQQNLTGYYEGDFNMDTQVDSDDKIVKWEPNAGKSSFPVRDTIVPLFNCGSSSVMFNGLEYGTVNFNNHCWLDRNLGASQVATAYNDPLSYGELFQWGRLTDGHQLCTSATTNVLSTSDVPGHGDFIIADDDPYDWRNPQNNNLWQETTNINNPCPDGWNVPSLSQWQEATTGWTNRTDAFNSLLKLPAAGWRSESAGNLSNVGSWGNYWTTAVNATGARGVQFDSFNFNTGIYARASGRSVRCLKTDYVPNNPPAVPSDPIPANGATGIETNINLSWVCSDPDGEDLTYNIYFGTDAVPPLIETSFIGNTWNLGLLYNYTTYYWRIVAYDIYGDSTTSLICSFTTKAFQCGDPFKDDRDGQIYSTKQIDEQCWMAENLNFGIMILGGTGMSNNNQIEKYCYDNNPDSCDVYGGLYQWEEIMQYTITAGAQGICPSGWHIPTDLEWTLLISYLGGSSIAGGKMKEAGYTHWQPPNTGATNESGFTALPSGIYYGDEFVNINSQSIWWSSTRNHWDQKNYFNIIAISLASNSESIYKMENLLSAESVGVRCINDHPAPGFPTLITSYISNIDGYSAIGGGNVKTEGNSPIAERGICWSTSQCPTINNSHTMNGSGTGSFISQLTELNLNTIYYVRAYATNSTCTGYGNMVSFISMNNGGGGEPCPGIPEITYEGQVYNTVKIGNQCWFRENLNIGIRVNGGEHQTNNGEIEKDCYHHESGYCDIYGGLYCWEEMMGYSTQEGVQGICPTDWHIPTNNDWTILTDYLGGSSVAGGKMKEAGYIHWQSPNTGATNESGFTGISGGCFDAFYFSGLNYSGGWWSSTFAENNGLGLKSNLSGINSITNLSGWGYSVRCLKNINLSPDLPSNPVPPDGAQNQVLNTIISWNCSDPENDPLTYDVYFGTTNPPLLVTEGQSEESYDPGLLEYNTTYFWQIIAHDNHDNDAEGPVWSFITETQPLWICGDTLIDTRDGQTYNTVQIGEQCWMSENLNIGTMIQGTSEMTDNSIIEKYCYDNITVNCDTYGSLYQWQEMMQYTTQPGTQGICPTGWHLPTDEEWCVLSQFIDPSVDCNIPNGWSGTDVGIKMKSNTGWYVGGNGTNNSGFTALPCGYRSINGGGSFGLLTTDTYFWSSTEKITEIMWFRILNYINTTIGRDYTVTSFGYSVRCVKDN